MSDVADLKACFCALIACFVEQQESALAPLQLSAKALEFRTGGPFFLAGSLF
jgi:hypothetical protein